MPSPSVESFAVLWTRAGCRGDGRSVYEQLHQQWHQPERHYHTWQHLTECLLELDAGRSDFPGVDSTAVEMALWFHDAVYLPTEKDNEERSAAMAVDTLGKGGAGGSFIASVESLILATKSHQFTTDPETALLLDIDLSIFGKSRERYQEYEEQILREYSWVPLKIFAEKRAEILEGFLARDRLYMTPPFSARYEETARKNLADSVARLRASG